MVDERLSVGVVMAFTSVLGVSLINFGQHHLWAVGVFFGGVLVSLSILGGPTNE